MRFEIKRVAIIAVLAAFAVTAVPVMSEDDAAKPRIVIEEMRHDLGQVYEAEKYTHKFTVKNTGTADLLIENVKPG